MAVRRLRRAFLGLPLTHILLVIILFESLFLVVMFQIGHLDFLVVDRTRYQLWYDRESDKTEQWEYDVLKTNLDSVTAELDKFHQSIRNVDKQRVSKRVEELINLVSDAFGQSKTREPGSRSRAMETLSNERINNHLSLESVTIILVFDIDMNRLSSSNRQELALKFRGNFRGMKVFLAASDSGWVDLFLHYLDTKLFLYDSSDQLEGVIKNMTEQVATPLAFVWLDPDKDPVFSVNVKKTLELFQNMPSLQVITFPILKGKQRISNCFKLDFKMYELKVSAGYSSFLHNLPICHYSFGPFIIRTELVQNKLSYLTGADTKMLLLNFYARLSFQGAIVALCTDCGTFSRKESLVFFSSKNSMVPFIQRWDLNSIIVGKLRLKFTCEEVNTVCNWKTNHYGLAMPLCCTAMQNKAALDFMGYCHYLMIKYELNAGTILGGLKIGRSMPWDIDTDIHFDELYQGKVYASIFSYFKPRGYRVSRVAGMIAFGVNHDGRRYDGIYLDFYPQVYTKYPLTSANLRGESFSPTVVHYSGWMAPVPYNPGILVRNRYGYECYQHALHWRSLSESKKDVFGGTFKPCKLRNHHACLDVFMPDGNIQFKKIKV